MYAPVKTGGYDREVPPMEPIIGVLAAVEYVGVHEKTYKGDTKQRDTVLLTWELEARDSKGKRFDLSEKHTLSLHEKSGLRARVNVIRPGLSPKELSELDLSTLVGAVAMVQVRHYTDRKGDTRAGVEAVSPVPRPMLAMLGEEGFVAENDYAEATGLAKYLRGEMGDKRPQSLIEYNPDKFSKPQPVHALQRETADE